MRLDILPAGFPVYAPAPAANVQACACVCVWMTEQPPAPPACPTVSQDMTGIRGI